MIGKLYQNKKYSRNFQYIEYGIKNLLEQPAVFGEKRTQKLSPVSYANKQNGLDFAICKTNVLLLSGIGDLSQLDYPV